MECRFRCRCVGSTVSSALCAVVCASARISLRDCLQHHHVVTKEASVFLIDCVVVIERHVECSYCTCFVCVSRRHEHE